MWLAEGVIGISIIVINLAYNPHAHTQVSAAQEKEEESKELARIMMSKKNQRIYRIAKQGQDRQKDKVEALVAKRRKIEQDAAAATSGKKAAAAAVSSSKSSTTKAKK